MDANNAGRHPYEIGFDDHTAGKPRRKQMTEQWFKFIAYNSQAHYGFGREDEADRYLDLLNENREINHYYYEPMLPGETAGLDSEDDTDGFRLEDEISTRLKNRECPTKR
jgi:hypothetical protein